MLFKFKTKDNEKNVLRLGCAHALLYKFVYINT